MRTLLDFIVSIIRNVERNHRVPNLYLTISDMDVNTVNTSYAFYKLLWIGLGGICLMLLPIRNREIADIIKGLGAFIALVAWGHALKTGSYLLGNRKRKLDSKRK
ncbi:MAG: hypothetical protein R3B92_02465 [Patescibacteria group bacterium]